MMLAGLAGAAVSMAGSAIGAAGTIGAAKANTAAARQQQWVDFNAAQMNQAVLNRQASEQRYAGQQRAIQNDLQGQYMQSSLKANAAFGGGTATDPTVQQLGGDIQNVTSFQKALNMFTGESRARGLEDEGIAGVYRVVNQGNMDVYKAEANERAAKASAMGSLIGSAGGLFNALGNTNFSVG